MDPLECTAEHKTLHRCKYFGDRQGHKSCSDIKLAWDEPTPPDASGDYYIDLAENVTMRGSEKRIKVFCTGMGADETEAAETFTTCNQCTEIAGENLCATSSCCAQEGMTEVSFDRMPSDARVRFSAEIAGGNHHFCTTTVTSATPQNFIGTSPPVPLTPTPAHAL